MAKKKSSRKNAASKKTTKKATVKKAATKKASQQSPTNAAKATKPAKRKRPSGLDYAAKVLAEASEPMSAKAIAERAIEAGWKTNGRTPWATLYAAMTREIADKGEQSRFRKVDRGRFVSNAGK